MADAPDDWRGGDEEEQLLNIALQQDIPNFNPFDRNSNTVWKDLVISRWCLEGLSGLDPGGNLYPRVAQQWTFDDTTLTVNITIREPKFHDNHTLDADDVVFSYAALRSGTSVSQAIVNTFDADGDGTCSADEIDGTVDANSDGTFEGVSRVSATKVKMVMGQANGRFFGETLGVPIIPEHIWEDHVTAGGLVDVLWNTDPDATIGTGPMYYDSGEADVYRLVRAFEDYWGVNWKTPSGHWMYPQEVDGINFTLYSNQDLAIQALKMGRLDHIPWAVDPSYLADLIMNPNTEIESISDNGYFYLAFNMKRKPMNLLAFRKAVSHVIDKETIVERYMDGYGQTGDSCQPPFWAEWYNGSVKTYPFDVNLAKQELQNGGFTGVGTTLKMPDGRPVPPLELMVPPVDYDPIRVKAGEKIAKSLRALGIDVVVKTVGFDILVAKMNAFDYDMLIIGWSLSRDPIGNVFDILGPTSSRNYYGFWSHAVDNPWYSHLGGVSTLADSETMALAEQLHQVGKKARASFDLDSQILYTKWGQGIVSRALPLNVLYYRVNNYAVSSAWSGWIAQDGELLNIFTLGAITSETEPPLVGDINILLNIPDKLPLGMPVPGNVIVHDAEGNPLAGATVLVTGSGMDINNTSGSAGNDGVYRFNVTGTTHKYHTLDVEARSGGNQTQWSKVVQVVAGDPPMAFLQVRPDKLFLGPGESTDVVLNVTDGDGVGIADIDVELEEDIMGYGSVNSTEVTTNATGEASIRYTAPSTLPENGHVEVRLSLSPSTWLGSGNTVTQFLVLMNEDPGEWHFVSIENVTRFSCNGSSNSTEITIKAFDEDGSPLTETIGITYSNKNVLATAPTSVSTDGTGSAKVTVRWRSGIDTNATQVFFRSIAVPNSVGAGASLLFKGSTTRDLYGGLISLKGTGTPMLDPDSGNDLTWEVWVYDIDGDLADVPVSFIVSQPTDGSTAAMASAPSYIWSSLWDYSAINIFTDADGGALSANGYFLSDKMSDAQLAAIPNNLYTSWQDMYDNWYGGTVDELEDMKAVSVSNGKWEVSVQRDKVMLSDNVPSLLIVPKGRAGFYASPDYANFWWQIDGETAWRTEFIAERTDTIHSPKYAFDRGILKDFPPGDTADVDIWVYDQDGDPVGNVDVDAYVQVYGGAPFFDVVITTKTDALGRTSATVTAEPEDARGTPLVNPVRQPMYIEPDATYGWNVLTSVEIFALPVQLYIDLQVTPITSNADDVHQVLVTARVFDETGANRSDIDVEFHMDGATTVKTTDATGKASVTLDVPELPVGDTFATGMVTAMVTEKGYGAASASHWLLSHTFGNELPVISDISIPDTGYETQNTTWDITGRATDDGYIELLTASLDGGDPVALDIVDGNWTFHMEDLTIGEHTVTISARDEWGLTVSRTMTFTILLPPNDPPVIGDLSIPDTGYETRNTTWSITGRATDDWSIVSLTARLDGRAPENLTLTDGSWEFLMVDLTVGQHTVTFTVEDEWGLSVNRTVTFTILPPPNEPPQIVGLSIPDTGFETQETSWSIILSAMDDGVIALVTASLDGGDPVDLTISEGDWPFHMVDLAVGDHTVTFTVEDAGGLTASRTVTFTISPPPNDPPVIGETSIPVTGHVTEDTSWSISGSATDDWTIMGVTATLDGGDPVEITLEDGEWTFQMEDLEVGEHTVTIKVVDEWGLETSHTVTFQVIDLGPPTGTVTLEEGVGITNSTDLRLTWQATDDRPVPWVRYSFSPDMTEAAWEPNDGSGVLPYDGEDGEVTVYLWFKDDRDRVSQVVTDTIVVDTTPPVIVITSPTSHRTSKDKITFEFQVTDNLDGTPVYRYRVSPLDWVELDDPTFQVTLGKGGVLVVEITAIDDAGNVAVLTWELEREEEEPPPVSWTSWIALVIIIVVVIALVLLWAWRGRQG